MASVEVVRGIAFGSGSKSDRKSAGRSRGGLFGLGWFSKEKSREAGKDKEPMDTPLGFTAYRTPPVYVGGSSVLVQVWAVGLDGVDARLVGVHAPSIFAPSSMPYFSDLEKTAGREDKDKRKTAPVGYIPGRSFVGRALEVGWDVPEDVLRKGEWIVGLFSVCGALAEFIVVDYHRVHRIPHPHMPHQSPFPYSSTPSSPGAGDRNGIALDGEPGQRNSLVFPTGDDGFGEIRGLTVNELSLVPLVGVPAYRAVRTLTQITRVLAKPKRLESSSSGANEGDAMGESAVANSKQNGLDESRPRVLVIRAHDGPGAVAVQMLVRSGWSVWAHVPVPFALPGPPSDPAELGLDEEEEKELERRRSLLECVEKRLRGWGAEVVLFVPVSGSVIALLTYLGRVRFRFDAVLDTVGGREVWEAGRGLLSLPVRDPTREGVEAQFTTLLGDSPDRVVPTARDHFRAGVRSLRVANGKEPLEDIPYYEPAPVDTGKKDQKKLKLKPRTVNYAWVNIVSDIDWEGGDIHDSLGAVLRMAAEQDVKPTIGPVDFPPLAPRDKGKKRAMFAGASAADDDTAPGKVVPFESTPGIFVSGGALEFGGTVVSRIVG
ncbi:hypothetical protein BV22DRAFT_1001459 [Leucogyrophana mollusca]|uniref:Uncharacterized protein n=1 Tax=Leucogyrophana mollusca TaxID=85980 RepID=A0ACB8BWY6_9AGAM|nr:hypothetical protein BV22DRAFT_1001459 [Leucogyrophana mollusca]